MPTATGHVAAGPPSHAVQFYGDDEELVRGVGGFAADGIADGGVAIVAATAAHGWAVETWLAEAGVGVAAARANGTLVALDAGETLRSLLVAGRIDPERFDSVIGQAVRQVVQSGRPVRVFGEMVALLWDAGQVSAALDLESLGKALVQTVPVSVFCAYPRQLVADEVHSGALRQVCNLHTAIVGTPPIMPAAPLPRAGATTRHATRTFPCTAEAPREARRFVGGILRQWGAMALIHSAEFVVTELASNAVIHAKSGFTVDVSSTGDVLRIGVRDWLPLAEAGGPALLPADRRHSLGVIAALASRWRAEPADGGKTVWAELRPRRP